MVTFASKEHHFAVSTIGAFEFLVDELGFEIFGHAEWLKLQELR